MTTAFPTPRRRSAVAVAALMTGAVLSALAAVMTYVLAVQTYTGQALENQGLNTTYGTDVPPAAFSLLGLGGSPPRPRPAPRRPHPQPRDRPPPRPLRRRRRPRRRLRHRHDRSPQGGPPPS